MNVCLPYRAELGHICLTHAPRVKAVESPKVVCCEPGMEALYPGADRYEHVEPKPNRLRREKVCYEREFIEQVRGRFNGDATFIDPNQGGPKERFVPESYEPQGVSASVVICPRWREYGSNKNWKHWPFVADTLRESRVSVFAAGSAEASYDVRVPRAWDTDRPLDASIEAMRSARFVVATDSGLAHLAVMCGKDLLLIVDGERNTAPGVSPVREDRYGKANHRDARIAYCTHGWKNPGKVMEMIDAWLRST